MRNLLFVFLITILSVTSMIKADEWLEWGTNYDDFGFATGHSQAMIASDFEAVDVAYRLNTIEYNASTMFGGVDSVKNIQWKIVEFDDEPLIDNQIGSLTGFFDFDGTGSPITIDVNDDTDITGHFAIALVYPDSMYHFFMMDENGNSDHTWFWKEYNGWVKPIDLIQIPGAWHLRLNVTQTTDIEGADTNNIVLETADFKLGNYPNPFNPTTNISFDLPSRDFISLTIYNNAGEIVDTIFEGFIEAGEHSFIFNGESLNSGVYYSILTVGNITQKSKITLVK